MIFLKNILLLLVSLMVLPLILVFALLCGLACLVDVRDIDMWPINKYLSELITDLIH